jgi:hypothetical protein
MPNNDKIICPNCQVEMNFHAVKIDYTSAMDKSKPIDRAFGGILEEFHACPKCGTTATREEKTAA